MRQVQHGTRGWRQALYLGDFVSTTQISFPYVSAYMRTRCTNSQKVQYPLVVGVFGVPCFGTRLRLQIEWKITIIFLGSRTDVGMPR